MDERDTQDKQPVTVETLMQFLVDPDLDHSASYRDCAAPFCRSSL